MKTSKNTFLSGCPNGWTYFSGTNSCYKFMTSSVSWNDARSACLDLNADLPSITNEATNSFLTSLTTSLCWTGGFLDADNKWKWTDGSTWGYTNWYSGLLENQIIMVEFKINWPSILYGENGEEMGLVNGMTKNQPIQLNSSVNKSKVNNVYKICSATKVL